MNRISQSEMFGSAEMKPEDLPPRFLSEGQVKIMQAVILGQFPDCPTESHTRLLRDMIAAGLITAKTGMPAEYKITEKGQVAWRYREFRNGR